MKDDRIYIAHILSSIQKIETYTSLDRDAFVKSELIQDAVIRNLEIIGEATSKISEAFRDNYPDIPWSQMKALRNVLIHNYMGVDLDIVWNVVFRELPDLKEKLKAL
ncbi:DUF86 domain-containing protein [Effusibacillus consociatus]|uniref:DUF86 domain-containing protein n=1 Tax=Effusibacillus consociatus TaxID=1117041 RepID=A0ABV9Q0I0_9BACL